MKKYTLRFSILSVFSFLFILSMTGIITYIYYNNSHSVMQVSQGLFAHVNENVINKTISHLRPASQMAELITRNFENTVFHHSCKDVLSEPEKTVSDAEAFFAEIIRSYPQLVAFYIGCENGYWLSAEKNPDSSVNIIKLSVHEKETLGWSYLINEHNQIIQTVQNPQNYLSFDPRIRPWYIGARQAGTLFWTDTYVYISSKNQLGITASCPVFLNDSRFSHAVIAADIEIEEISRFLKNLKIGKSGFAYILNRNQQIIAGPVSTDKILCSTEAGTRICNLNEMPHSWLVPHLNKIGVNSSGIISVSYNTINYIVSYQSFPEWFNPNWKIVIAAPESDFTGELTKTNQESLLVVLLILLVSLFIISKASKIISQPIAVLTEETNKIREFNLDDETELSSPIKEIYEMNESFLRLKKAMRSFTRYVPETLVKNLILSKEEAKLGGKKEMITVFFSDIKGFTSISEKLPAEYLAFHVSEYLNEMTKIILSCGGTIDKYIGDSIMAFWGAPIEDPDHAYHACQAALRCQQRIKILNEQWKSEEKPEFLTRIGIHTGITIVGNIGSEDRMNYTAMGDTVNVASRLEGLNKEYNTEIIISEVVCESAAGKLKFSKLGEASIRGKDKPVAVYELTGMITS